MYVGLCDSALMSSRKFRWLWLLFDFEDGLSDAIKHMTCGGQIIRAAQRTTYLPKPENNTKGAYMTWGNVYDQLIH